MRTTPLTVSYLNRKVKRTVRVRKKEDWDLSSYDELEELFEMYKMAYKEWNKKDSSRSESQAIRLRKILSQMRKVAKKRRFEVQEFRYNKAYRRSGL